MELLAIAIRRNQNIIGIEINNIESKIGLFVDDIIIMLSHLNQSIFHLLNTISVFGNISGYTINESKSAMLFLKHSERLNPPIQTLFKVVSLPNLKWYYWAARLSAASCWFSLATPQSWVNLERVKTSPLPLNSYLYSAKLQELKKHTHNPFVRNTIQVWYEVHLYKTLSQFSPIWDNTPFTPGKNDMGFKLFDKGRCMCFEDLRQKYDIQPKHFFFKSTDYKFYI